MRRIEALRSVRSAANASAWIDLQVARDRRDASAQDVIAAQAGADTARINHERVKTLGLEGLSSKRRVELAQLELDTTTTKLGAAKSQLAAAGRAVQAGLAMQGNVSSTEDANVANAEEELNTLASEVAQADAEVAKAEIDVSRQQRVAVTAPIAGTVLQLVANGLGELVEPGDRLATLVPNTGTHAVELLMGGNDAPLITRGRHVGLQFDGWPAVQFCSTACPCTTSSGDR